MKYSHSDSEDEGFTGEFDSEQDALEEALSNYDDADVVYVGECHKRTIGHYLTQSAVENLLESLAENAGDDCGEAAHGWLEGPACPRLYEAGKGFATSAEQKAAYQIRIDAWRKAKADRVAFLLDGFKIVLETWATEEGEQPDFWHVENVKAFRRDELP